MIRNLKMVGLGQETTAPEKNAFVLTPARTKKAHVVMATDISDALQQFESNHYSLAEGFSIYPANKG